MTTMTATMRKTRAIRFAHIHFLSDWIDFSEDVLVVGFVAQLNTQLAGEGLLWTTSSVVRAIPIWRVSIGSGGGGRFRRLGKEPISQRGGNKNPRKNRRMYRDEEVGWSEVGGETSLDARSDMAGSFRNLCRPCSGRCCNSA